MASLDVKAKEYRRCYTVCSLLLLEHLALVLEMRRIEFGVPDNNEVELRQINKQILPVSLGPEEVNRLHC